MPVAVCRKYRVLAVCLCAGWMAADAQEPAPNPQEPPLLLKATTRLVDVSVIVQHKGQPVTGFKADDFTVADNGKRQKIAVFSMETSGALPAGGPKLPPDTFTNRLEQRAGTPASVTIVLLDVVNTRRVDRIYAKREFIRFLKTIQPRDHIGVYALAGGLRILHDYTTDSSDLVAKIASLQGINLPVMGGQKNGMDGDSLMLDAMLRGAGMPGAERDFWTENRVKGTLFALEFIANHLAQLPGRKNLIWISGGFPLDIGFDSMAAWHNPARLQETFSDQVDKCIRALNNANLAIYPVDARALMVDGPGAERRGPPRRNPNTALRPSVGVKNQQTMRELADRTGGRAYYNRNDLDKAIRDAVDDSRVSYTLGYYPSNEQFDGKFHKIDVKVHRGGMNVRFRRGYFDLPAQLQDEEERRTALREAVFSPLDATALGLTVSVYPGDLLANPNQYRVDARVDAGGIGLQREQGRWNGKLDILFVQKDDRGNEYNGRSNTLELRLQPGTYRQVIRDGVAIRQNVERHPKATELRVLVRDSASGSMGSVKVRFSDLVRP
ncbi:MAG: VWA domain-containing protein [Bryobacteraceae bacterium]